MLQKLVLIAFLAAASTLDTGCIPGACGAKTAAAGGSSCSGGSCGGGSSCSGGGACSGGGCSSGSSSSGILSQLTAAVPRLPSSPAAPVSEPTRQPAPPSAIDEPSPLAAGALRAPVLNGKDSNAVEPRS